MLKFTLTLSMLMLLNTVLNAQKIKGIVYESTTNAPIPGATVLIENEKKSITYTNENGAFEIEAKSGQTILVKMLGFKEFKKQIVAKKDFEKLSIYLEAGVQLNDVVVTASLANSRSKKSVGANIDYVDVAAISATKNPSSIADILNGRISGAQIYNTNGKVGMPVRFDIRSAATFSMERDPLIFIDGVRYSGSNTSDINSSQEAMSALNDLPLNDIESINVIKGPAAAASYGSEAANGVIVIQTKRGTRDKKGIAVNVKYTNGFSELARKYDQYVNNDDLNNFFQKGNTQQLYANFSAQFDPKNSLFFSANTNNTSGIIPGNKDNRQTIRTGYDFVKDNLKFSVNAGYVTGTLSIPQSASGRDDALWNLMRDQKPWPFISEESWRAIQKEYKNDRFTGSAKLSYSFPFGIKAETLLGLDLNNIDGINYLPYGYLQGTNNTGYKQTSKRTNQNFNWDVKLSKNFVFNPKLQLNLSLISQLTKATEKVDGISVRNFALPNISNSASAAEILGVTDTYFEKRTQGTYGEAFLNYNDKLFINTGIRRDVSNMIGRNVASIWYPTISVAYNINELGFLTGIFENWKLRTAYGESGRLPYPNDAQTAYLVENSSYGTLIRPLRKGNPDIKPERTGEFEIGTDISIAKQKISFTYYLQNTKDAIVYTTLLPSLGWPSSLSGDYPENIGKIRGQGLEISYNGRIITSRNKQHSLDFFINFNHQSNKVINSGGRDILNSVNLIREGLPAFTFYSTSSMGPVFNSAGVYTGAKESALQTYGRPFPEFNGSFGYNITLFKNFSLQTLFNYSKGAKVYNISNRNVASQGNNFAAKNDLKNLLATQTPGSPAYIETATALSKYEGLRGDFIEKADFVRLSNLTISYNLSDWTKKQTKNALKTCVLSVTGNNLWLKTNYGGAEPQIDSQGGSKRTRGISYLSSDWTAVPAPRNYAFSLNIGF